MLFFTRITRNYNVCKIMVETSPDTCLCAKYAKVMFVTNPSENHGNDLLSCMHPNVFSFFLTVKV